MPVAIHYDSIPIHSLSMHQLLNGTDYANTISTPIGVEGGVNPLYKLKTVKWHLVLFQAYIMHITAKSMVNLTIQLCGDL